MDENVAKAVARIDDSETVTATPHPDCNALVKIIDVDDWQTIRARLVELEAENERLKAAWDSSFKQAMQNGQSAQEQRARAEKAEALLRDLTKPNAGLFPDLVSRITAHLSENGHG